MFGKIKSILGMGNAIVIMSPMDGVVIPVTDVKDPIFHEEMLGKGVAIIPSGGCVVSPVNGTVDRMFETFHAISLVSEDRAEVLIHIGMDTVKLKGQHFTAMVKTGDAVKTGDMLIKFDREALIQKGYDLTTPVIVCNFDEYKKIRIQSNQDVKAGESLITLER